MKRKNTKTRDGFFRKNKLLIIALITAVIVRIVLLFDYQPLWWDSGVYIGMGKYIFSLGRIGLWEPIRPLFMPLLLGFLWKIKLNPIIIGRILEFFFSIGSILLIYLISEKMFDKKTAIVSAVMLSFSSVFLFMGFRLYNEVPTVFFVLSGIYLFAVERYYLSGMLIGVSFLSKFPAGIFILCVGLAVLFRKRKKNLPDLGKLGIGFLAVAVPFLIFNHFMYGNAVFPFFEARKAILEVLGCNVLRYHPWNYYFKAAFFDNFLNIFAIFGVYYFFKEYKKISKRAVILLSLVLPLIYFSQLHCRDFRYLILFVPFIVMLSSFGLARFVRNNARRGKKKRVFIYMVIFVLLFSLGTSLIYYTNNETGKRDDVAEGYYRYLEGKVYIKKEIWSSNPLVAAYTEQKIKKMYYPVYNGEVAQEFLFHLRQERDKIGYVFVDNCGGGIICHPDDAACLETRSEVYRHLENNFNLAYNKSAGRCKYLIFSSS